MKNSIRKNDRTKTSKPQETYTYFLTDTFCCQQPLVPKIEELQRQAEKCWLAAVLSNNKAYPKTRMIRVSCKNFETA
jgi:hypothetical protein